MLGGQAAVGEPKDPILLRIRPDATRTTPGGGRREHGLGLQERVHGSVRHHCRHQHDLRRDHRSSLPAIILGRAGGLHHFCRPFTRRDRVVAIRSGPLIPGPTTAVRSHEEYETDVLSEPAQLITHRVSREHAPRSAGMRPSNSPRANRGPGSWRSTSPVCTLHHRR